LRLDGSKLAIFSFIVVRIQIYLVLLSQQNLFVVILRFKVLRRVRNASLAIAQLVATTLQNVPYRI